MPVHLPTASALAYADHVKLTVGALSSLTGIPVNTLRTWERRYGLGAQGRSEGGQRLYGPDAVEHLQLVGRGIAQGHRPSHLLAASTDALRRLLGDAPAAREADSQLDSAPEEPPIEGEHAWLGYARQLDGPALLAAWNRALALLGMERFLLDEIAPFLAAVGDAWARHALQVYEEHFVSELLTEFLSHQWRPLADAGTGPRMVLATLPGELHALGLHLAACLAVREGWRVTFLGRDTPLPELILAAERSGASAVLLSLSPCADPTRAAWDLTTLRQRLAPRIRLVVGGAGVPPGLPTGIEAPGIEHLAAWLRGGTSH